MTNLFISDSFSPTLSQLFGECFAPLSSLPECRLRAFKLLNPSRAPQRKNRHQLEGGGGMRANGGGGTGGHNHYLYHHRPGKPTTTQTPKPTTIPSNALQYLLHDMTGNDHSAPQEWPRNRLDKTRPTPHPTPTTWTTTFPGHMLHEGGQEIKANADVHAR